MALSASLTITNNLTSTTDHMGSSITFTAIDQVNDDATWSVPATNSVLQTGLTANLAMGNSSMIPFVRGCGANVFFTYNYMQDGQIYSQYGQIYLEIPAIGPHTLWGHTNPVPAGNPVPPTPIPAFAFAITNNGGGNNYQVDVTFES